MIWNLFRAMPVHPTVKNSQNQVNIYLKGLLALFQVSLHEKMGMSDDQRYPVKLCLIKYVHIFHFSLWFLYKSDLRISTAGKHWAKSSDLNTLKPMKTTIMIID